MTTPFTATLHRFESGHKALRIVCRGDIDIHAKERFLGIVEEALRHPPNHGVVLDLSAVGFIDSNGLQTLMTALLRLDHEHITWNVTTSAAVQNLLELVGIARRRSSDAGGWLASGGYGRD
jgi:anti-anti-sigma factor